MIKGIDISVHNFTIDFKKVKQAGIETVIIKATEGVNFIDEKLEENYKMAKANGLNIGFYHFMSEKTSPTEQAKDFYEAIKDKEFNIFPCLDIETNKMNRSAKEISDRCIEFLEKFEELSNLQCMIYTGGYFGRDNLDDRVKKYLGWIAHYNVSSPMETGFKVVGHQYTEKGTVDGISTNVDMNNFSEDIFINSRKDDTEEKENPADDKKALYELSIQGEEVKELQRELNIQYNAGLKVDGYFGDLTLKACVIVKEGARGNLTKLIQQRLINRGYTSLEKYGGADGIFGNATTLAIKALQKNKGIDIDGIVGKDTWKALYSLQ